MSRTDVVASSRPLMAGAGQGSKRSSTARMLSALALLVLALALVPSAALAATEPTSGYNQEPTSGYKQEPKTKTSPSSGVSPAKEEAKAAATSPVTETTTTEAKASTLPFTGFDLRWEIGFGVLLILGGLSIVAVQRRRIGGR